MSKAAQTRIYELIIKQLIMRKLSPQESVELENYKSRSAENREVVEKLTDPNYLEKAIQVYRELDVDDAWRRVTGSPLAPDVSKKD